jgi:Spy/CpxP family protein refolding chaperone
VRSTVAISILALTLGLAGAALADPAPPASAAPAAKPAKKEPSPDDVICADQEVTGSLFSKRVCLTRAQRTKMAEDGQKGITDSRKINEMSSGHP